MRKEELKMSLRGKYSENITFSSVPKLIILIIMLSGIFLFPALLLSYGNDEGAVLTIHSDQIDGSTIFIDDSASTNIHTITANGNVRHEAGILSGNVCDASKARYQNKTTQ